MKEQKQSIADYISGRQVSATPEEVDAVQVFARQLVDDYGYPKYLIQTHPQYRVKVRPSDAKREYPVDIAVFDSDFKNDSDLYIVVECKKKNSRDGRAQLENYLTLSNARLGVWFNGEERIFLRKNVKDNGEIRFEEIPNIPLYKQRMEDIGKYRRADLKPTHNLKVVFRSIRSFLAANNIGATRDEALAQQLINIIFCKIYDEKYTAANDFVRFRAGANESAKDVGQRIIALFEEVKVRHPDVIDFNDEISLDANSLRYVVGELQNYSLMLCERDAVADAFETFIGHALKGGLGQFFTPRNVVKLMVEVLQPTENDKIIDPACGSGGFLIESLKSVWEKINDKYTKFGWSEIEISKKQIDAATKNFRGIDKDYFLSKVAKAYMNIVGDGTTGIFCEDSLEQPQNWKKETQVKVKLGEFDMVLTNPPFGDGIKIKGVDKLKQYKLARAWSLKDGDYIMGRQRDAVAPQILFIDRCLQLLKPKGRMAIVLPDGFFNESMTYLREYLLQNVKIIGIIDACADTFQPSTATKTSLLFFEKYGEVKLEDYEIFMAIADFCGHDRRGILIPQDDFPNILLQFKKWQNGQRIEHTNNCFTARLNELKETNLWTPKHFLPFYTQPINRVKAKYRGVRLGDIAALKRGSEPGSKEYIDSIYRINTDVPFIRTSDLMNYAANQLPDNFVSEEIFNKHNQDLQPKDILFTKDGKIGVTAMIKDIDRIMIASGILRIRLMPAAQQKYSITPEYLFAVLSNKYMGYFQAMRSTIIGTTIPHVREKRIGDFFVPIIDADIMAKITDWVSRSFQLKNESAILDAQTINIMSEMFNIEE